MDGFVWKESFNTGNNNIDSQHRILLEYLNQCLEKSSSSQDDFFTHTLFIELEEYSRIHFKTEENFMKSCNYPNIDEHIKQHNLFNKQLEQLETALINGDKHIMATITTFLRDWFIQHILDHDKKIVT
jgi:hemerythrin-like metal-binding protein